MILVVVDRSQRPKSREKLKSSREREREREREYATYKREESESARKETERAKSCVANSSAGSVDVSTIRSNDEPFSPHYSTHIPTNLDSEELKELLRQKSKKTGQGIRPKNILCWRKYNNDDMEFEREREREREKKEKRGGECLSSFMPDMNSSSSWYFHHWKSCTNVHLSLHFYLSFKKIEHLYYSSLTLGS